MEDAYRLIAMLANSLIARQLKNIQMNIQATDSVLMKYNPMN